MLNIFEISAMWKILTFKVSIKEGLFLAFFKEKKLCSFVGKNSFSSSNINCVCHKLIEVKAWLVEGVMYMVC